MLVAAVPGGVQIRGRTLWVCKAAAAFVRKSLSLPGLDITYFYPVGNGSVAQSGPTPPTISCGVAQASEVAQAGCSGSGERHLIAEFTDSGTDETYLHDNFHLSAPVLPGCDALSYFKGLELAAEYGLLNTTQESRLCVLTCCVWVLCLSSSVLIFPPRLDVSNNVIQLITIGENLRASCSLLLGWDSIYLSAKSHRWNAVTLKTSSCRSLIEWWTYLS